MREVNGIIYIAVCNTNGKAYVGQTYSRKYCRADVLLEKRRKKHIASAVANKGYPFTLAIKKYGPESFEWRILHTAQSIEELNALEVKEIAERGTMVKNGYNAMTGGASPLFSPDVKSKMSASAKRRWAAPERRALILSAIKDGRESNIEKIRSASSAVALNILQSKEVRDRANISIKRALNEPGYKEKRATISRAIWRATSADERKKRTSKWRSAPNRKAKLLEALQKPEYKKKAGQISMARYSRPFEVIAIETGQPVAGYSNIVTAAKDLGVWASNISACLRGKAKSFGWGRYVARFTGGEK